MLDIAARLPRLETIVALALLVCGCSSTNPVDDHRELLEERFEGSGDDKIVATAALVGDTTDFDAIGLRCAPARSIGLADLVSDREYTLRELAVRVVLTLCVVARGLIGPQTTR